VCSGFIYNFEESRRNEERFQNKQRKNVCEPLDELSPQWSFINHHLRSDELDKH